jgi:HEXXH motif-containing protein
LITTHRLPEAAFTALASGDGDLAVVRQLREAQHSKHLMLLHAIAAEAKGADPASREIAAFGAGYELLAQIQLAAPDTVAWLVGLPHLGAWAHDCVQRMEQGLPPDFGYLATAAAAAAVRAGHRFELDVPVRNGQLLLPGLGRFHVPDAGTWIRLHGDGERLAVGSLTEAPCTALVPDDGSAAPVEHWQGTYAVRVVAQGQAWTMLLETTDRYLDRFAPPMAASLTAAELARWRNCLQAAWELLVRHHAWAAGPIAAGVSAIVPFATQDHANMDSATTPAAFGTIATSLADAPVMMAEVLVHEFQHIKLCGLQDMMPLIEPGDERVYAPWRPDPRPAGGLLQGVYAHLGIARFWNEQRYVEDEPEACLRAHVMFARSRSVLEPAAAVLLRTGKLTPPGWRFVAMLRDQGQRLESENVPAEASEMAREITLDHWLTWQLRHAALDRAMTADLAAAYQRGESRHGWPLPETWIEEETRKVASTPRSRLLSMRFLEPHRYGELSDANVPGLSRADRFLLSGQASAAVRAYRDEISASSEPLPEAWAGLALAVHLLDPTPWRAAFAERLPLMFDTHACLLAWGVSSDPLEIAAWFA